MLKLMGKLIFTILLSKSCLSKHVVTTRRVINGMLCIIIIIALLFEQAHETSNRMCVEYDWPS